MGRKNWTINWGIVVVLLVLVIALYGTFRGYQDCKKIPDGVFVRTLFGFECISR